MSEGRSVEQIVSEVERKQKAHLMGMLKELHDLGVDLPPGEYTVAELLRKVALAKARKAAMNCGPTEARRGE